MAPRVKYPYLGLFIFFCILADNLFLCQQQITWIVAILLRVLHKDVENKNSLHVYNLNLLYVEISRKIY